MTKKPENKIDFKKEIEIMQEDIDYLYSDNCDSMNRCTALEEDVEELQEDVECLDECIDTIDDTILAIRKRGGFLEDRIEKLDDRVGDLVYSMSNDTTKGWSIASFIFSIIALIISIIAVS